MNIPKSSILERELVSRIRDSAREGESATARAMAATVIVASDSIRAASADATIDRLMGRRPARVLHVRSGSEGPSRAWTSARCALDRASRGVCFEDIFIESPDEEALDPRIWGPFLIRELPAILFWNFGPGALTECGCGPFCAERVDLVVADGSLDFNFIQGGGDAPVRNFIDAILQTIADAPAYSDLAWERLENLRLAVARLFDGSERRGDLAKIVSISVSLRDSWSEMLVEGWLRSRLSAIGMSEKVEISLVQGDAGLVFVLEGGRRYSVGFPTGSVALLSYSDTEVLELGFRETDDGLILANLLDDPAADPMYRQAISAIRR